MSGLDLTKNIPEWMNEEFFVKVVRHMEKDQNAKVINFDCEPATKPGGNFASAVFRSKVTFTSKYHKNDAQKVSLIVKSQPVLGPEMAMYAEIIAKSPFFPNEMEMYGKVLPEIHSILSAAGDKEVLSPKLIYQSNEPSPVIVLEDACELGYNVIDKPLDDFEESKKIFRRLAKFHAGSFYLVNENKADFSDFNYTIYQEPTTVDMIFSKSLLGFCGVMKDWKEFEKFAPAMENFSKTFLSKALRTYKPNRGEMAYNVLNHADFHVKNLVFKHEQHNNNVIEDFKFIDFQICAFASPAIDLIYALYNFTSSENRQKRRNELISLYHQQFVESLKNFGYMRAPPSLIDLQIELLRNGHLEVLLTFTTLAAFYYDLSTLTAEDFDQGEGTKNFFKRLYNTPAYKDVITKELPRFFHCGFLQ